MSAPTRRPGLWLERTDRASSHEIVTPEGIPLRFAVSSVGDRFGAFVFDLVIIVGSVLVVAVLATLAFSGSLGSGWLMAFTILLAFLMRSFYFVFFELRWQGTTPGKRRLKLRVIDRRGGPLQGDAVFVRNLMREVEFFLPLQALTMPEMLWPGATGIFYVMVVAWLIVFALMPLFNKKRLRIGDLVAGTIVVNAPSAQLLSDLSVSTSRRESARQAKLKFTTEQLEIYGIYELQVLERLLRRDGPSDWESLTAVADTIKRKIGWSDEDQSLGPEDFLRDFYAAQRARLEHKMIMGTRQEFKRDKGDDGEAGRRSG